MENESTQASEAGTLYLAHVLTHATRSRLDAALSPFGLTSFHYTILSLIARNDALSSSELSRRFYVTPQAMGEVILLLERRALILRSEDRQNRKLLRLGLTATGHATLLQARAISDGFEDDLFADCAEDDLRVFRAVLRSALQKVRDNGNGNLRKSVAER